jgi:hypothetical protein
LDDASTLAAAGFVLARVAAHHDDAIAFIDWALGLNVNLASAVGCETEHATNQHWCQADQQLTDKLIADG